MAVRTNESAGDVPTLDIDLYDPAILPDPWPLVAKIREAGPVVWNPRGFWMTGRDRVCRWLLNRPNQLGQSEPMKTFFGADAFISIDERHAHNQLRDIWVHAFDFGSVKALSTHVRKIVDGMLDAVEPDLRAGKPVDLMAKVCRPLPAYVIAYMMGVEDDMIPTVIKWSDLMADATLSGFPIDYDNDPHWLAAERARKELAVYLKKQFAYRRNKPGKDLISTLVHARLGKELSEEAMTMNTRQLIFAGNETTAKWLGHILVTFGRRQDVRDAVNKDRSILPTAIEEVMRWLGVSQVLPREVKEDMVVEGVPIKAGQEIIMIMAAANRDPERYANPEELDIYRERKPHLGFGLGLHSCLGAVLARMEAAEFTAAVLDRFPNFQVVEPVLYTNFSLRGPSAVHVQLPLPS